MTEIRRTDVRRGNFSCSTPKLCGKGGRGDSEKAGEQRGPLHPTQAVTASTPLDPTRTTHSHIADDIHPTRVSDRHKTTTATARTRFFLRVDHSFGCRYLRRPHGEGRGLSEPRGMQSKRCRMNLDVEISCHQKGCHKMQMTKSAVTKSN